MKTIGVCPAPEHSLAARFCRKKSERGWWNSPTVMPSQKDDGLYYASNNLRSSVYEFTDGSAFVGYHTLKWTHWCTLGAVIPTVSDERGIQGLADDVAEMLPEKLEAIPGRLHAKSLAEQHFR